MQLVLESLDLKGCKNFDYTHPRSFKIDFNPNNTGLFEVSFFWGRVNCSPNTAFIFQEEEI